MSEMIGDGFGGGTFGKWEFRGDFTTKCPCGGSLFESHAPNLIDGHTACCSRSQRYKCDKCGKCRKLLPPEYDIASLEDLFRARA